MSIKNPYQALLKISEEINSVRETSLLFDRVMDIAIKTLHAESGFILLKSPGHDKNFEVVTARNISSTKISSIRGLSSSVVNQVLEKGKSVISVDAQADERFSGSESIMMHQIKSVICAPLIYGNQLTGAIYMDSKAGTNQFDSNSLKFLEAFSGQAAIAINNSRIFESLQKENKQLKKQISFSSLFPEIIGKSKPMQHIFELIHDIADSSASILIEGESGTGKELVARALHVHSSRNNKPFIPIFCHGLSENLLESELFGHKKGSFTGASENKAGLFEEADGGTVFLDEIAEIGVNIQTKLLRVLQEREIKRVGETQVRKVDVRIISATNKDLEKEVDKNNFREDLFYRINVITIKLPPLRERKDDIPLLADHFLKYYAKKNKKNITHFSKKAYDYLFEYHWPGNVRELENTIERSVILTRGTEIKDDLFQFKKPRAELLIGKTLKEIEKYAVLKTLEMSNNNRTKTAGILDVSRRWLQYQLKDWGIVDGD